MLPPYSIIRIILPLLNGDTPAVTLSSVRVIILALVYTSLPSTLSWAVKFGPALIFNEPGLSSIILAV